MISFTDGYYGWLGNQMFQYAATRALSLKRKVECAFPQNRPNLHTIFRLTALPRMKYYPPINNYTEPHFHYDPAFWNQTDGTELHGYFQSTKYFEPFTLDIRREFMFRRAVNAKDGCGSIAVHVRRGDYLALKDHHPPCSEDYYRRAMSEFPGARFVVFSDDLPWCRANMAWPNVTFAVGSLLEDFAHMQSCDHHIIANSSFSWWAAYLGKKPGQRVIAPRHWFGPAKAEWDTKDLLPESWEKL